MKPKETKLTLKMLRKARKHLECPKCHSEEDWLVCGYPDLYCKCKADKLSKTKRAKDCANNIRKLMQYKPKTDKKGRMIIKGKIATFCGIPIMISKVDENDEQKTPY